MSESRIAVVGMGCCYPDARSPAELWENVLSQRRAFRRMPEERLRLEDYRADAGEADSVTPAKFAVIEGFEFDRVRFRTAGTTYREVDLAHWLALDVAAQTLADAGFPEGLGLPRETTGVLVGNTLTGEFSRAHMMRLRWPYVRRVVGAALADTDWSDARRREFLDTLENRYKSPFPPSGGETLAGGLSNTIAGRICNHFDLNGGGYTVDGACASSLLAVTTACGAIAAGDLDVALAGGVDLSLDPFELVGFSRVGVLAREDMRVYDAHPTGFWPGEGCGFVVLMREENARAEGRRIYGVIRGWGVASDGSGGTTRPEVDGQLLALRRAYRRAGFGAESVGYFEGHGTGTEVGDQVELEAILRARGDGHRQSSAALGSIKANIGHTKAAAGVAGFIKATMALYSQVVPPLPGRRTSHPRLADGNVGLRIPRMGELWPNESPLRAAVSAMGFGGIDTHVVIEGVERNRKTSLTPLERTLVSSPQDAEIFVWNAADSAGLRMQLARVLAIAGRLSFAELADLAAALHRSLGEGARRATVIASTPDELLLRLGILDTWLETNVKSKLDPTRGIALGWAGHAPPRVGFLFPGQGSPSHLSGGIWRRRFEALGPLYESMRAPENADSVATQVAQPAIVTHSLAALHLLSELGIRACVSVGHSLGEISACHWAGAFDEAALVRIATARGRAMADLASSGGAMASLAAPAEPVRALFGARPVVIAGLNGSRQTVIAGDARAIAEVVADARAKGIGATMLAVSHAFHSPLVAAATPALQQCLERESLRPLTGRVISTVTGAELSPEANVSEILCRQVTEPVRFAEAVTRAESEVDLWLEVGPGHALSRLVADLGSIPAIALDSGSESLAGLLRAAGTIWALGGDIRIETLFARRFTRPFDIDRPLRFFANPCEEAPLSDAPSELPDPAPPEQKSVRAPAPAKVFSSTDARDSAPETALEVVRRLVAEQVELPLSAVSDGDRFLSDLHLNSITVSQLAIDGARRLGFPLPADPTSFAGATVAELAQALSDLGSGNVVEETRRPIEGVGPWVRPFVVKFVERARPVRPRPLGTGAWRVFASAGHPLAPALERAFQERGAGGGVIVCLSAASSECDIGILLEGAQLALKERGSRFVLVHAGSGGGAFARSLHLESRDATTCVVEVPFHHPRAVEWVLAEANAALGYHEAAYDGEGCRREPVLALLSKTPSAPLALGASDVMIVTGGGKGIAAECALALAREYGLRLGLVGRSRPEHDSVLAANLERFSAAGVTLHYAAADVTDSRAVHEAVRAIEARLGRVTAFLHGAGINEPLSLSALTEEKIRRTLAPKLDGARNVLSALHPDSLRLFIAFGSIIARSGLRGEADYGLANEWLTAFVERFQTEHSSCRCLAVEWSVWSGVGMGEHLGSLDALIREGITPISPEVGVELLSRLLRTELPGPAVVVAGRVGERPTLAIERPSLPLRRFIGRPAIHYPGVELVVETEISAESDPYLRDHEYRGLLLFPAVVGLEAMAQVAMALVDSERRPLFENVVFRRPITIPRDAPCTLRLAALVDSEGHVDVVIRSSETGYHVNHFEARCRFDALPSAIKSLPDYNGASGTLPLDPEHDLYDGMLFQRGRFQRVRGYRLLRATECLANVTDDGGGSPWFGPYLPTDLVLGDPGARDAAIHSIQACVPHATVLPTGVARIVSGTLEAGGPWSVHAFERLHEGDRYVYDLEIAGADGSMRERWEGLELRGMPAAPRTRSWPWPLLGPYVERRVAELIPGSTMRVALSKNGNGAEESESERAIGLALGRTLHLNYSPNGRPEVSAEPQVAISASHAGSWSLAIGGTGPLGCDLEDVATRSVAQWRELLGSARFDLAEEIARESSTDLADAATRVWSAQECLTKVGWIGDAPLTLAEVTADGWIILASGRLRVATYATSIGTAPVPTVVAVLQRSVDAGV